ncbi:MAG: SLC13 family permease [Peptococcaceae bacterium]|nr:SLC13 family permease [Peptococcaceae bacterium]
MTIQVKRVNKNIKIAICFIIPILLMLIPTSESFTSQMRTFIAITAWLLLWAAFEITDLLVPSLIWPVVLTLLGIVPAESIYSSWLSYTIPCCMAAMVLSNMLQRVGLLERLSYWIMAKCGGSFNRSMYALYFACLIMSFITFAGASIIIAGLCYGMCRSLHMEHKEEAAITMMVGMIGGSTVRMFIFQPLTQGLIMGSVHSIDPNFTMNFWQVLYYNWPVILYSVLTIFLFLFLAKTKNSSVNGTKEYFEQALKKKGKLSKDEKKGIVLLAILMIGILTNSLHHIDGMAIFVIVACLAYCPGVNVGKDSDIKSLPIGIIFFISACMAIGAGCMATGLTELISNAATPILSLLDTRVLLFGILIFGIVLNLLMTPMAMVATFSGPMVALCAGAGINPLAPIFTFLFSTDMVFLPYEYVTFLIFFAFGMMTTGQFVKYHTIKNVVFGLFFVVVMLPFWSLLGLI